MSAMDPTRQQSEGNYERRREVYKKNRYRIEQVIGIVKNRFGDRDCVRDYHVASLHVLARFALYNLILPFRLLLLCLNLLRVPSGFPLLSTRAPGIFPAGSNHLDILKEPLIFITPNKLFL